MAHRIHTARAGDCIARIAFKFGFFPETVWNDPKNSELKEARGNPNMLCLGDDVYIREKEQREETCQCEQRNRFLRKGVPEHLRLRLMKNGEPLAKAEYVLDIEGQLFSGATNGDGWLELMSIPPDAVRGRLTVAGEEEYEVLLGSFPPIDTDEGLVTRLQNLGYLGESEEEEWEEDEEEARELGLLDEDDPDEAELVLRDAIASFQVEFGLPVTGDADPDTRAKIEEAYGA
jgi:hypothetical protein